MEFQVNVCILEKKIEALKISTRDIFHDEPFIYTALALQSMGFTDEQILQYLSTEMKNYIELNDVKFEEFKCRNDNTTNNNV